MISKVGKRLAKKALKQLPEPFQLKVVESYASHKAKTYHKRETPDALTFFVTKRCNERCEHCFYWTELNTGRSELTLEEIEKIAASMTSGLGSIALTGGEPFLRKDLREICKVFHEKSQTRAIGIASNGYWPDRIQETCEWVLSECKLERFNLQISLDGLEETHDEIRKVPKAFARAIETIKILSELKKKHENFSVNTSLAIQPRNYDEIEGVIEYLKPLDVEMKFLVVRGSNYGTYDLRPEVRSGYNPKVEDTASISLNVEQLESLYFKLKELNDTSDTEFWYELEQAKMHTTLRLLEEQKRIIPCHAGTLEGVMYSNGDVAVCEMTKPFGNVKDADYDFEKLWQSEAANWMRSETQTCGCVHDCNLTTGLRFHPEILYSTVMGRSLKNREKRWRRERKYTAEQ